MAKEDGFSFRPADAFKGRPRVGTGKAMVKARVTPDVKDGIRRAVELGVYESEQEMVERAVLREYEERLVPMVLTGEFDKGTQLTRRLTALAEQAKRTQPAVKMAADLVEGMKALASHDPEGARNFIEQTETELRERPGAWAETVQAILQSHPAWLEMRRGR